MSLGFPKRYLRSHCTVGWYSKMLQIDEILRKIRIYFESVWLQITLERLQTQTTLKGMC